jgi:hypothetical protein
MESAPPAGVGFSPLDDELGLLPGHLTPRLQEGLVRLSTHIPSFGKAAVEFAYWTQVDIHRTSACRITEAAGATVVALQTVEAAGILHTHPRPAHTASRLLLSVDGAMVPLLHGQWAEARTLLVGEPQVITHADGQVQVQTTALSYFSRLTDSSTFAELATVEIQRRGVETADHVGAVVDGAEWCQTFLDLHAPQAQRILDFAHAAGYVDAIGQTAGADGPLRDAAGRRQWCHDLKHAGPQGVLAELRELVMAAHAPGETASQLAYLEKRVEQLAYPTFQAAGWPIGSGSVESANKLVVQERLKGPGMHWAEANVNPMLALRNAICNDRWDEVWMQIEGEQRRAECRHRRERQRKRRAAHQHNVEHAVPAVGARALPGKQDGGGRAEAGAPLKRPPAEQRRPAADHPWNKAWSIRRQREIASQT